MRVAEIMGDFRARQHYIASIRVNPSPEDYYLGGYVLIRECMSEAQRVLAHPYAASADAPRGDSDKEKSQLRGYVEDRASSEPQWMQDLRSNRLMDCRVILDASVRRFQLQKAYLRALAAQRWIHSRDSVLKNSDASSNISASLESVDRTLREVRCIPLRRVHLSDSGWNPNV
jgi:hypothetical protein